MTYENCPVGKYTARAKSTQFTITSTGKDQLTVWFDVATAEGSFRLPCRLFFSEGTEARSVESLRNMGFEGTDISPLLDLPDASAALPALVEIVVEHEEYEGRTRDRVRWINRIGGGPNAQAVAPDAKRAFAARMKGLLAGKPAAAPVVPREKTTALKSQTGQHSTKRMVSEPDNYGEYPAEEPPF